MPQSNSPSSSEAKPDVSVDESNNEANSETGTCRRSLRTKPKNVKPETSQTPEKKPVKTAAKRKQPVKNTTATKSPKSRSTKKKAKEPQEMKEENFKDDIDIEQKVRDAIDEVTDEEDMEEGEIPSSIAAESKTYYSCKLCHKDFTSAFILCLHLQIHEKVASTPIADNDSPAIAKEGCENPVQVKVENDTDTKNEEGEEKPAGLMNKNFVENLKRNLSLAMSKNNL